MKTPLFSCFFKLLFLNLKTSLANSVVNASWSRFDLKKRLIYSISTHPVENRVIKSNEKATVI